MSEVVEYALPRGWCWASIEELTAYVQRGKSPKYTESSAPRARGEAVSATKERFEEVATELIRTLLDHTNPMVRIAVLETAADLEGLIREVQATAQEREQQ